MKKQVAIQGIRGCFHFNDIQRLHQAINAITPLTQEFKTLGIYQEGEQTI